MLNSEEMESTRWCYVYRMDVSGAQNYPGRVFSVVLPFTKITRFTCFNHSLANCTASTLTINCGPKICFQDTIVTKRKFLIYRIRGEVAKRGKSLSRRHSGLTELFYLCYTLVTWIK